MSNENPYAPPDSEVSVEEPMRLASLGARLGGALIDGVVYIVILLPIMYATGHIQRLAEENVSLAETVSMGLLGLVVFLLTQGYLLAKYGQTIGKRLVKTRIVSVKDQEILSFGKVVSLRYLPISLVSQIPIIGSIIGFINILFIFRRDRRCIHDLFAGTKVIAVQDR